MEKLKSFRVQFRECTENKTVQLLDTKEIEMIYPRFNKEGIEFIECKTAYFCNKYMTRCSSKVCFEERLK